MTKPRAPRFAPLTGWQPQHLSGALATLTSSRAVAELRALAPDLIRLQLRPTRRAAEPSWAILPTDTPAPPCKIRHRNGRVELETSEMRFRLHLATGVWTLHDAHGIEIFASAPGKLGFAGTEARLALKLAPREAVLGLGETTGTLDKRGTIKEFWNTDVLGHAPAIYPGMRSLYLSIPFALSLRDGRFAGLFWDNPARQTWDLGHSDPDTWQLSAASGAIDLYLFTGPKLGGILERYTALTGRIPLPPRWALGYHQSRYSYTSRDELESIAREFRRRRIPCDALYCDIHHLDDHRVFTFGKAFPKPREMVTRLRRQGFQVVAIANPGVKDSPRFGVLQRGRKADAFVKDPSGKSDFLGEVWPGTSRFPDFLCARVRDWWAAEQNALLQTGVAGVWNDMNEPANFARPDKTLDPEALHHTDDGPRRHREVHNVYGMQMARASQEGMLRFATSRRPRGHPDRPFVITRAGYAGVQRHAIVWTGDTSACWEHLAESLPMLLNLGLSGVPFAGSDVGGFLGNPTPELYVRWLQLAVFTPFFRTHSNLDTRPREPWSFGPEIERIARDLLQLRYQLLPYLYGLLHEASQTGAPILRPLAWHHPNDPVAAACADQFLLGENLLIAPVLQPGAVARSVYLPRGEWYDFWSGELISGGGHLLREAPLNRVPVLVRSGTLLPMVAAQSSTSAAPPDTVFLHVWPRESGRLAWYDDDGATQAYETGEFQTRTLSTTVRRRGGQLAIGPASGSYPGTHRHWRVLLRGVSREHSVRIDGRPVKADFVPELGVIAFDMPVVPGSSLAVWR